MNKKAFELSINFIVILILSIVIFGFGIKFLSDFMKSVDDITKFTDSDFNANMEKILCDSSERTCIGISRKEIRPNKVGFFTFGVLNTYEERKNFYVDVEQADPYENNPDEIKYRLNNELNLDTSEQDKVVIAVQVPGGTKKGTYVLNVYVCSDESISCGKDSNNRYGTTQKLYVVVP
ncbi:MAG: hypothetical protein KKA61_01355 [Nanoarchaeota archaeon]|nr:hypothetical protein [Nanoarchaeota archaeon]MBU4492994.1 hypothetical protein [Nanoarchaeota archaeon]